MIQFTATPGLIDCLAYHKISIENYKPAYGGESVGLDLYNASTTQITIVPNRLDIKIPSGIRVALAPYFTGLVLERGSIIKTPLKVRAGVLDPGYTAELFINCVNIGYEPYTIEPYAKLPFQLVVVPCVVQYNYIDPTTYEETTRFAERRTACIGSSDVPTVTSASSVVDQRAASPTKKIVFDLNAPEKTLQLA